MMTTGSVVSDAVRWSGASCASIGTCPRLPNLSPAPQPVPNLSRGDVTEPVPKAHRVPRRGTWLAGTRSSPAGSRFAGQKLRGEVRAIDQPTITTGNLETHRQRPVANAGTRRHQDGHGHHYRLPLPGSAGARAVKANVVTGGGQTGRAGRTGQRRGPTSPTSSARGASTCHRSKSDVTSPLRQSPKVYTRRRYFPPSYAIVLATCESQRKQALKPSPNLSPALRGEVCVPDDVGRSTADGVSTGP